jgi:hypothetical protein
VLVVVGFPHVASFPQGPQTRRRAT